MSYVAMYKLRCRVHQIQNEIIVTLHIRIKYIEIQLCVLLHVMLFRFKK